MFKISQLAPVAASIPLSFAQFHSFGHPGEVSGPLELPEQLEFGGVWSSLGSGVQFEFLGHSFTAWLPTALGLLSSETGVHSLSFEPPTLQNSPRNTSLHHISTFSPYPASLDRVLRSLPTVPSRFSPKRTRMIPAFQRTRIQTKRTRSHRVTLCFPRQCLSRLLPLLFTPTPSCSRTQVLMPRTRLTYKQRNLKSA